ncbi:MAG: molybdenum cofactor guanylyltransferase [Candidatus Poseidoniia archaeon]|jgi:molybdopterin-guanine dinucleotide biosynthesis protein A|nr:molybdenum cofactor guanylyltransferase [Candidatus Poseidoniia archaeon]MDP7243231.1 molybdenum cofactor guanylyltransferase [Candidatus Poseidoniia archaeon]MDP7535660.1 molybdenum cofactor guanylyltransferase [Candidatus Poseidoniia archaeon]MDP7607633.1 molybdenum cofactor guanylyltransferase [Candidatus Poseidoniia archaeon]
MDSALMVAGGQSSRLGQLKQSLEIEGESLAARTAGVLAQVAQRVTVVGPPGERPDWVPTGCGWVGDPLPHGGPLVGLAAGLAAVRGELVAVAPCDLPLLAPATYRALRRFAVDGDAAVATWEQPQPLVAVYWRETALAAAELLLAQGEHRAQQLLGELPHTLVERREVALNLNTPTDLERFHNQSDGESEFNNWSSVDQR